MYVKYIKWVNIAKGITKITDKKCILDKKIKTQQQQNRKSNIKICARTRDLSHSSRMCYLWTTMSTESIDACQAI